jgi:EAL domain-containing protein (putative c-di-GMP-specific phosphodiesterase class I)
VAEGVENEDQVVILQKLGCDYLQGFFFAPPLPEEEAEKLIKNQPFLKS